MNEYEKRAFAIGGVVALASLLGFLYYDAANLFGPSLVSKCEEVLKDRLMAPSGYKRISVTDPQVVRATIEDFLGWTGAPEKQQYEESAGAGPRLKKFIDDRKKTFDAGPQYLVQVLLTYDAPNGFGTPIRGITSCTTITIHKDGKLDGDDLMAVRADGYNALEWSMKVLREAGG